MKQLKFNYLFIALAFATLLASCRKDKINPTTDTPTAERAGMYILNQGGYNKNNSTLTYYDYTNKALTADIFASANTNTLGDVGNDLGIYGSKMYIVVNNSNVIFVTNKKTAKTIKQIALNQPRSVVFYKSNAFVTSYNGTVSVIDTATLTITKTITVGSSPEQMAISNGKLYVANSGGLDYPNYAKTVSVVDLTTLTETKKIDVIVNPGTMVADAFDNIYVLSFGDYNETQAGITVINAKTDVVTSSPAASLGYNIPVYAQGDYVYYPTADNKIAMYNAKTQTLASASFVTDNTAMDPVVSISGDPQTGEIFVGTAPGFSVNGNVFAFDKTGKKEYVLAAGIGPGKIVLLNK